MTTLIPGNWLGSPHDYQIVWAPSSVTYYIDGNLVATAAVAITADMQPLISDYTPGGGVVTVASMQVTPYATSGTFVSRIFNAISPVTWTSASWTDSTPAGTALG